MFVKGKRVGVASFDRELMSSIGLGLAYLYGTLSMRVQLAYDRFFSQTL